MENTGPSLMGIGKASGENRAIEAAKQAINSPLLELSIDGARGVLFNVSGGSDLTMAEINEAANVIIESIDPDAKVIFGAITDEGLKKGEVKVTVIATGFGDQPCKKRDAEEIEKKYMGEKSEEPAEEKVEDIMKQDDQNKKELFQPSINPMKYDDEYDVPAFIRKKMNKKDGDGENKEQIFEKR